MMPSARDLLETMANGCAAQAAEPRSTRRTWLRSLVRGVFIGSLFAGAGEAGRILVGNNCHTVKPGKIYRCAQPSPEELQHLIHTYGIRTVINLRGCGPWMDWYLDECRMSAQCDVCHEDLCFSASRLPSVPEMRRLVEILDHCEYPVLFHCFRGADRTGLASATALLLTTDVPYDVARRQLSLRYGHIAYGRTAYLDCFFDLYREWLAREGLCDSRKHFRRWLTQDYCPAECRAMIEAIDLPASVRLGQPFAARVRIRNTAIKPWPMRPGTTSGVHVAAAVYDAHGQMCSMGRAGLFDAVVQPGESMELTVPIDALHAAGRYFMLMDLVDEQQGSFYQMGSEPLEWEFDVRQ